MANIGHHINSADALGRQILVMRVLFAGTAAVAALVLFSAGPSDPQTAVASGPAGAGSIIPVNDDDAFNPSSGDIFKQNAQDQSNANGAGT
jgi:hypothetical protein